MRRRITMLTVLVVLVGLYNIALATDKEQELVNKFLQKIETKHTSKLGWVSASFSFNRINRDNKYNSLMTHLNTQVQGATFSWLDNAKALSLEFGTMVKKSLAWSVGGEYWLTFGQKVSGLVDYAPEGGTPVVLNNPSSQLKAYGVYTGFSYYLKNAPVPGKPIKGLSLYAGGTAGYYQLNWDVFSQYQNLNLSTATPDGENTTFKGSAPGFTGFVGASYPLGFGGMLLSGEVSYLRLNFTNVAWYNSQDQEVIATYASTTASRVDVNLSSFRGRVVLRKFFSW